MESASKKWSNLNTLMTQSAWGLYMLPLFLYFSLGFTKNHGLVKALLCGNALKVPTWSIIISQGPKNLGNLRQVLVENRWHLQTVCHDNQLPMQSYTSWNMVKQVMPYPEPPSYLSNDLGHITIGILHLPWLRIMQHSRQPQMAHGDPAFLMLTCYSTMSTNTSADWHAQRGPVAPCDV